MFGFFWRWKIWYFWAKKLIEIWYLLITEKFLFWNFWWWKIGLSLSKDFDEKMIFTGYWEVLLLNFSVMGNTVFFSVKKLMERWYLLDLFELSIIFQDLENMAFRAVLEMKNYNMTSTERQQKYQHYHQLKLIYIYIYMYIYIWISYKRRNITF